MRTAPPGDDVIEISVFGPGYGECILVHLGYNEWIIVDSCIHPKTGRPAALDYLRRIGVPLESVKLIVATHWHDDHIRGLCHTVKECGNADFVMSEALIGDEFLSVLSHFGTDPMIKGSSGARELFDILSFLKSARKVPKRAMANTPLWMKKQQISDYRCIITALSPSDYAIYLSNFQIAKQIPELKTEKRRLLSITPNQAAVVLWIRINHIAILLGSDLESSSDENSGWLAILQSPMRPEGKADVFKVPHHGSVNGDHPRIWDEMVSDDAIIALTPFHHGKTKLPTETDIQRICEKRSDCFITATNLVKKVKTERTVDRIIEKAGGVRVRRPVHGHFGQIRIRTSLSSKSVDWSRELMMGARAIC